MPLTATPGVGRVIRHIPSGIEWRVIRTEDGVMYGKCVRICTGYKSAVDFLEREHELVRELALWEYAEDPFVVWVKEVLNGYEKA